MAMILSAAFVSELRIYNFLDSLSVYVGPRLKFL